MAEALEARQGGGGAGAGKAGVSKGVRKVVVRVVAERRHCTVPRSQLQARNWSRGGPGAQVGGDTPTALQERPSLPALQERTGG